LKNQTPVSRFWKIAFQKFLIKFNFREIWPHFLPSISQYFLKVSLSPQKFKSCQKISFLSEEPTEKGKNVETLKGFGILMLSDKD